MWKAMGGVKTIVGLSAFSLALAYLITGKLMEKGLIQSSTTMALLLIFFFLFVVTNLLIVVFHRKWQITYNNFRTFGNKWWSLLW